MIGSENFGEIVIKFLIENLTIPPQDINVITCNLNQPRVDELKKQKLTVRTVVDYENEKTLNKTFAGIKRLLIAKLHNSNSFTPMTIAVEVGVNHVVHLHQNYQDKNEEVKKPFEFIEGSQRFLSQREIFNEFLQRLEITYTILEENPTYESLMDLIIEPFLRVGDYYTQDKSGTAAFVSKEDVALVAAKVLANDKFENHISNVTGPQLLNRENVLEIIREILGVNMTTEEVSTKTLINKYIANGHSSSDADDAKTFDTEYSSGMWSHITNSVRNLTQKEPEAFKEWLMEHKMQYSISQWVSNKTFPSLNLFYF